MGNAIIVWHSSDVRITIEGQSGRMANGGCDGVA